MTKIKLTTGLGYLVEKSTGKIRAKFDLPPGEHEFDTGKYDVVEVSSHAELNAIVVEPEVDQNDLLEIEAHRVKEELLEAVLLGDDVAVATLRQQYKQLRAKLARGGSKMV